MAIIALTRRGTLGLLVVGLAGCVRSPEQESITRQLEDGEQGSWPREVQSGDLIRIIVTNERGEGTTVQLFDPDGQEIWLESVDEDETFEYEATQDGEYEVRVNPHRDAFVRIQTEPAD